MEYAGWGYRTLCVRACDGYYFPVSFSTSRARFKIDEAVCKSMYGGEAANLYVHHNGSPSDTAVSLTGEPLAASTNAFAYRHFYSPSCQVQLHRGLASLGAVFQARIAATPSASPAEQPPSNEPIALLPTPTARPAAGLDPETMANMAGHFSVRPVRSPDAAAVAAASAPMRRLGPDYYYATPIAIDAIRDPPQRGPVFSLIGTAHAGEVDDQGGRETSVE